METTQSFVQGIVERIPELQILYRDHLADNDELLPHVFMGDVSRLVIERLVKSPGSPHVEKILLALDEGLRSGNGEVRELIAVSFVENFAGELAALQLLVRNCGAALRAEVRTTLGV